MKITKRQLRRIIREEKAKIIAENRVRKIVRRNLQERRDQWKTWDAVGLLDPTGPVPEEELTRDQWRALGSSYDYVDYLEIYDEVVGGEVGLDAEKADMDARVTRNLERGLGREGY
tara:strand:- start:275 stop:622 length:348 start_codon:yes stop_codon:yes gene_type:complete